MKRKRDTAIITARIGLIQAVLVAVITTGLGVLGTLFQTGLLWPKHDQTSTGSVANQTSPAVLNAPYVYFSSKPVDVPLDKCMQQARQGVAAVKLTGQEAEGYLVWGYRNDTTGYVWCNTDHKLVIFVAAGPDRNEASRTYESLKRSF